MEHSLSHVIRNLEHEREDIWLKAQLELDQVKSVAARLTQKLTRKTGEMKQIKHLAQHILNQRTDLEKFFKESFDRVKQERLIEEKIEKSENLEVGVDNKKKDLSDLSWKSKEKILRVLFAKMNATPEIKTNTEFENFHADSKLSRAAIDDKRIRGFKSLEG